MPTSKDIEPDVEPVESESAEPNYMPAFITASASKAVVVPWSQIYGFRSHAGPTNKRTLFLNFITERLNQFDEGSVESETMMRRVLAALPTENIRDDLIGPFYDTAGLAEWRAVSRQAISRMAARRRIIAVKTSDNELLYPSFQFDEYGRPSVHLFQVLTVLDPDNRDSWGDALWLNSYSKDLEMTPMVALHTGTDTLIREVLNMAERAGNVWAS